MDLQLPEIGATFIVGAYALLLIDAIWFAAVGGYGIGFFRGKIGYDNLAQTAIFIAAAFIVGVMAEDLSYKWVDTVDMPFASPYKTITRVFIDPVLQLMSLGNRAPLAIRRQDLRLQTLLAERSPIYANECASIVRDTGDCNTLQPASTQSAPSRNKTNPPPSRLKAPATAVLVNSLGFELGCRGAFQAADVKIRSSNASAESIDTLFCSSGGLPVLADDTIREAVDRLYYHAKNTVYRQPQLNDEMRQIESRANFCRSLALISFVWFVIALPLATLSWPAAGSDKAGIRILTGAFLLVVVLLRVEFQASGDFLTLLLLLFLAAHVVAVVVSRAVGPQQEPVRVSQALWMKWIDKSEDTAERDSAVRAAILITLPLALLAVYYMGMYAYLRELEEFDKRVFGYYSQTLVPSRTLATAPLIGLSAGGGDWSYDEASLVKRSDRVRRAK